VRESVLAPILQGIRSRFREARIGILPKGERETILVPVGDFDDDLDVDLNDAAGLQILFDG
jgi:hypothetical protein